jgi:HK97 gp10 family phage protein
MRISLNSNYQITLSGENWEGVTDRVRNALLVVIDKVAFDIEAATKQRIRGHNLIDTGNLLNSVQTVFPTEDKGFTAIILVGAEYGIYHEFGTVRLPAKPFLRPSVEENTEKLISAITEILERLGR